MSRPTEDRAIVDACLKALANTEELVLPAKCLEGKHSAVSRAAPP